MQMYAVDRLWIPLHLIDGEKCCLLVTRRLMLMRRKRGMLGLPGDLKLHEYGKLGNDWQAVVYVILSVYIVRRQTFTAV